MTNVLVTALIPADTEMFRQSLTSRKSDYRTIAERAQSAGAVHHRFAIPATTSTGARSGSAQQASTGPVQRGDAAGHILVQDEWTSEDAFRRFFEDPELQTFIKSVGGSGAPPEITVAEVLDSPDQF